MASPRVTSPSSLPLAWVGRLFLSALIATLAGLALYLIMRRLSGALQLPLEFLPALAAGLLLSVGAWLLRRWSLMLAGERERSMCLIAIATLTWLIVVAITLSPTSPLAVLALWLPMIATEAHWRVVGHETPLLGFPSAPAPASSGAAGPLSGNVVQQWTRTRAGGSERVSGTARIDFAAGEQTAAQHIAFCPPLAGDPEVEVDAIDADGVTVRATDCHSYGLRLEARRGQQTAAPLSLLVSFEAVASL